MKKILEALQALTLVLTAYIAAENKTETVVAPVVATPKTKKPAKSDAAKSDAAVPPAKATKAKKTAEPTEPKAPKAPKAVCEYRVTLNKRPDEELPLVTLKSVTNTLMNMYGNSEVRVDAALAELAKKGKFVGSYKTFEHVATA